MTESKPSIMTRFQKLPPVWRNAIVAAGVVVVYVFLDDYCWSYARQWTADGDRLQSLLQRGAARQGPLSKDVESAVVAFGAVELPDAESRASESLAQAVNETMKKHRITSYGYEAMSGGKLPSSALTTVAGAGRRIERLRGEIQFEAPADEVAQILNDFEEHSAIDSINSVKLTWLEDKNKVGIRLSAEAWAIASRDSRQRGGS
ncbi:MAG: hypothetical protein EXS01_01650 [Phycisphaerales bacterium]|nr:hypothetical protein [Phycisphaerales bacterium]